MTETPTFTLDDKTRGPLVQIMVDVALYAFRQGVENAVDDDPHKDCERQFVEQLKRAEAAEAEVERLTTQAKERANAYSVRMEALQKLLKDSMDFNDSHRIEEDSLRERIRPIVGIFGITEWGSNAYVLRDIPDQINEQKENARMDGYHDGANIKTNGKWNEAVKLLSEIVHWYLLPDGTPFTAEMRDRCKRLIEAKP